MGSIRSMEDFDKGLKELLEFHFKDKLFSFIDENGKNRTIPVEVMYEKPEGEFKPLEYDTSLRIYFKYLDEEPDYRRDVPECEYIIEDETDTQVKIKLPPKKLDLFYAIGYKTNKRSKASFLWTELMKCFGDRGCAYINEVPVYYAKSGSSNKVFKDDRIIQKEFIYRFKAELDFYPAEWTPKVLYYPQITTQIVEKNENDEFETLIEETSDLEQAIIEE